MSPLVWISIVVFVIGLWIGVGAPGWPHKDDGRRRHTKLRTINPIAWGRTSGRERQKPKTVGQRRINLRG